MSVIEGWGLPTDGVRLLLARHLIGKGLEIGALHHPYRTRLSGVDTVYVDRWTPDEARRLFPELGESAEFVAADIVADIDAERLSMIENASQDYVIASHVLEHVANPLAQLEDIHRVLRPGGTLLILLPDMRRTSDPLRAPTTLERIVEEYEGDVRVVDDAHLEEHARTVDRVEGDGTELEERLSNLVLRSVHAHAWTEEHFFPIIHYAVEHLGCGFELVELLQTEEFVGNLELGYVLRRTTAQLSAAALAVRLKEQRALLMGHRALRGWVGQEADEVIQRLTRANEARRNRIRVLERRVSTLERRLARYERLIRSLRRTPVYPVVRFARRGRREHLARRSPA